MKVTIVETKEFDDWIKVYVDGQIHACIPYGDKFSMTRDEALARADEITVFCFENGTQKILKELESTEV
jgi:hypothetical protein